ncbi:COR domain-containing protein [Microscilla marina]|uniref:non-specific serine/threonine protein kinase n=1 Tax=Microscilla marina ATCC 23134 TaxID=313606 RepID=A1ZDW8_MICM2|nr:COR domain-containing protein [Microscilla marina]EAY31275.1 leucine-rich-repeat protein, putative [Microscilla marina ATCC 23134]
MGLSEKVARKIKRCKDKKTYFLNLRECSLSEIPTEIFECTWLTILDLGNYKELRSNHITTIPTGIAKLTNLKHLDLRFNEIQQIAPEFGQLKSLQTLMLDENQMSHLPKVVGTLEGLTKLALTGNCLGALPESLSQLSQLRHLKLGNCGLKTFPEFILSLKELVYLDLSNNALVQVPEQLSQLKNLENVLLDNNQLEIVPKKVFFMPKVKKITLEGNVIASLPDEVVQQGVTGVQNFYQSFTPVTYDKSVPEREPSGERVVLSTSGGNEQSQSDDEVDYLNEIKLLLVGEGRVGKTSLAKALRVKKNELKDEPSTEGIDISQWVIPKEEFEGKLNLNKDFRLNVWDFGGQEIYYATHQFFLTRRSIYLFVTESRKEDNHGTFFYWLNIIRLLGGASPVILVLNKIDQPTKELPIEDYKAAFANLIEFKRVSCHADYKATVESLKEEIKRIITNEQLLPQIGAPLPKVWVKVRKEIEALQNEQKSYISYSTYLDVCEAYGMTEEQAKTLSRFFHDLGVFLHFANDLELAETVFLDHQWVTKGVYAVLDNAKVKANYGRFTDQDLMEIWSERKYREKRREILSLMKHQKFELCFAIEQGVYLAPQLLPADPVSYTLPANSEHLYFEYSYSFMPKGILTRLIVRRSPDIYQNIYWKYGVVLYYDNTYAVVRENYLIKRISVHLSGKNNKQLLVIIRKTMQEIHSDFNNLEVTEMIPCHCSECKDNPEPYFYKYQQLKRRLDKGRKTVECDNSYEDVSVVSLLDGVGGSHSASLQLIRDFIAKDFVHEALDVMEQYAQQLNDRQMQDEVIGWKAALQQNERSRLLVDTDQYHRQKNRIIDVILNALKHFDE